MGTDLISREAMCDAVNMIRVSENETWYSLYQKVLNELWELPSAEPEPLTDKEQRIFLAAMGREEKVCKEVDAEEPYGESLVSVCREIERKVKKALWAN